MSNPTSKDESIARVTEVLAAAKHLTEVAARGHSYYIRENGRYGKHGAWAELIDAVRAVLPAETDAEIARLKRQLALSDELEQAMAESIGVKEGQTFEERAEELIVMEVAEENRRAAETTGDCCPCCGRSISVHDNADRLRAALKSDPLAGLRWICRSCTTVNGIDDERCLGCRKPREEHDRRAQKSEAPRYTWTCKCGQVNDLAFGDICNGCMRRAPKINEKPSASTGDTPPAPTSPVECPKCRTQLAFEGDECGLCKEEES